MKKALFSLLILFCISISHAQDFYEYKISPSLIVNGDSVELTFSAKDKIDFHKGFPKLDDLRYVGASRGQNIVNNYRESHITLTFVPRASGDITIPPIEVTLDGKIYKCKARTFKVWPSGANYPQDKIIMTRVLYNGKDTLPKTIYTGQAFVIDYEISVVGSWRYLAQNTFNDFRPKMKAPNLNLMVQAQDFNRNLYFNSYQ